MQRCQSRNLHQHSPSNKREGEGVLEKTKASQLPSASVADNPVPPSTHLQADSTPAKIEKSELTIGEPRRHRDKGHLKFVAPQPCLVCGRRPADAHHLRFTQPRAMGRKVSDEFTVPLCPAHHRVIASATRPPGGVDRPSIPSGLREISGLTGFFEGALTSISLQTWR
jgi:hypothetical protein